MTTITFNVAEPTGAGVTPSGNEFFIGSNPPAMNWGIEFQASATPPSGYTGTYTWIQLVQSIVETELYSSGSPVVCTGGPGVDGGGNPPTFPYATGTQSEDGPTDPLSSPPGMNEDEEQESGSFIMYLMWNPDTGSGSSASVAVPLGSISWNTAGDVVWNSSSMSWVTKSGTANQTTNGSFSQSSAYPTWTQSVTPQSIANTCEEQPGGTF
jgi:hypothetical protein